MALTHKRKKNKAKNLNRYVLKASRTAIISGLESIKFNHLSQNKLVNDSNLLLSDAIKAIEEHPKIPINYSDVQTYVSASTLSHLLDGWGYISNSVKSLLNGDPSISVHLAYYAELRAVMSILACEGIGIFDTSHLWLTDSNNFVVSKNFAGRSYNIKNRNYTKGNINTGTHNIAWQTLDKWSNSRQRTGLDLLEVFSYNNKTFKELTEFFIPNSSALTSNLITRKWLRKWAFDIDFLLTDRNSRNFVSYRPQTIDKFENYFDFNKTISDIYEIFNVLSPNGNDKFSLLDINLLKQLYYELFRNYKLSKSYNINERIENAFTEIGLTFSPSLRDFFMKRDQNLIFTEASKLNSDPLPVISRATLLLRVATGMVSRLLREASISKDELTFIWKKYGFDNGFWYSEPSVSEFYNLWVDIEDDLSTILNGVNDLEGNQYQINEKYSKEKNYLSQFNRAVLWGI